MCAGIFLANFLDRIDGVRGWIALQFAVIYRKLRFRFRRAA